MLFMFTSERGMGRRVPCNRAAERSIFWCDPPATRDGRHDHVTPLYRPQVNLYAVRRDACARWQLLPSHIYKRVVRTSPASNRTLYFSNTARFHPLVPGGKRPRPFGPPLATLFIALNQEATQ